MDTGLGPALGVADREILDATIAEVNEAATFCPWRLLRCLFDDIEPGPNMSERLSIHRPIASWNGLQQATRVIASLCRSPAPEHQGVSERRACALVGVSRRLIRYEPTRPDDGALWQRQRELAAERRRFGYRRLGYLLAREGITPNH